MKKVAFMALATLFITSGTAVAGWNNCRLLGVGPLNGSSYLQFADCTGEDSIKDQTWYPVLSAREEAILQTALMAGANSKRVGFYLGKCNYGHGIKGVFSCVTGLYMNTN